MANIGDKTDIVNETVMIRLCLYGDSSLDTRRDQLISRSILLQLFTDTTSTVPLFNVTKIRR